MSSLLQKHSKGKIFFVSKGLNHFDFGKDIVVYKISLEVRIDNPDHIEEIKIDRRSLPKGHTYHNAGYESRQVFDIKISRVVTEYHAEVLEDEQGNRYVATFPNGINTDVSYGASVKSDAVYHSQFQLLPYKRIKDYFSEKVDMPLSAGSLFNFNREAYTLLENFESVLKQQLILSRLVHVDETGINVNKEKVWLHCTSNELWTYFYGRNRSPAPLCR